MKLDSFKKRKDRMNDAISLLAKVYPDVKIQLNHTNAFELLVATMLSAQCTDARVNIVTESLFIKYKTPTDYLAVEANELEQDIFSTGFYKNKAKNIRAMCEILIATHNSQVPNNLAELFALPGVGRKTANVVLGHAFNTPGIVVDTHVIRISNKLGIVDTTDAVKIEFELMKIIPKDRWVTFTHYFINHGRNTCIARRPQCAVCTVNQICSSSEINIIKK